MKRDLRGNIIIIISKTREIFCVIGSIRNNNICCGRRTLTYFVFHRFFCLCCINTIHILFTGRAKYYLYK